MAGNPFVRVSTTAGMFWGKNRIKQHGAACCSQKKISAKKRGGLSAASFKLE